MDSRDVKAFQDAVYVMGMAAGSLIEAMGMQAENLKRQAKGEMPAYDEKDFNRVIENRGLHHNTLMSSVYGS